MSKILIVEDDENILELEKDYIEASNMEAQGATNGNDGLELALNNDYDLILLDVMLPGINGFDICKKIRETKNTPVIFVTAKREEIDKISGLGFGADDYIVKPFSLVELEARVQAHLRREERHQTNTKVKFSGELLIDYSERTVYIQNQPIGLVKKEFDIVELLSQNAGQVFDKERIYERVWGYDSEGDSSVVAEHIRRIRTKIAAYTNKSYIETVWGCGYKWIR